MSNTYDIEDDRLEIAPPEEEADFWQKASSVSAGDFWNNTGDDVYAELLDD